MTYEEFVEALFNRLGRGRQQAGALYSHWFRYGNSEAKVEPQAAGLLEEMKQAVDWGVPQMSSCVQEGALCKFLLKFSDGLESESVLIPMQSGVTICISSQVGCKMGCAFCYTGKMGLIRHLTTEEIVQQVFVAKHLVKSEVRNVVFMGMGEPFDNYEAVMKAIAVLTDPHGVGMGLRRITVSTSGRVDGILRMAHEAPAALNLAVSVNAPTDEIRQKIMPVNQQWNLEQLKQAMQTYCEVTRQEILIEYVLLKGINDSLGSAQQLAQYLRGLPVRVNLIPYNAYGNTRFAPPEIEQTNQFLAAMRQFGYQTMLRGTKGDQVQAACGQLGNVEVRRSLIRQR